MARQLRLSLRKAASHTRDEYVHGASNALATAAVDAWPGWAGGCLTLVGPEASGKTHLARAWAGNVQAVILDRSAPDLAAAVGTPALLEDVDQGVDGEALFHLINLAARKGSGLLLTARNPADQVASGPARPAFAPERPARRRDRRA